MKSISKLLILGTFAVAAIALSAAPSEAAKKKAKKMAPCTPGMTCTAPDSMVKVCGGDGKWYQAIFTPVCVGPVCPAKC